MAKKMALPYEFTRSLSDSPATALRYPHGNLDPRHRQRNQRRLTLESLSEKVGP